MSERGRLRVLQLITRCDLGGAQTIMRTLTTGLRDAGHDVMVACGEPGPTSERLAAAGIRVEEVAALRHGFLARADRAAAAQVRALIDDFRPDLVHCHSSKAGLVGRWASRRAGVPSVYTAHGWPFQHGAPLRQRVASYTGEVAGARLGQAVICVSATEAAMARRWHVAPQRRVHVVANGVDDRAPSDPSPGPPHIVMVARLSPPKRPDLLIAGLAQLGDLDWTCSIVGSGPQRPLLVTMLEELGLGERIVLAGDVDDAGSLVSPESIAVLLSDYEGQPVTLIEAMRAGAAILASDLPGMRELLGVDAELVANTAVDVASGLRRLLDEPDRRARLGATARRRFEAEHRADLMVERTVAVYRRVLQDPRPIG
jgi:glycosyltransferase involved in cell wall biosynthesis